MPSRLHRAVRFVVAFVHEVALVALAALVYFGVRGLTEGSPERAYAGARSVMRLEEALGIAWERGVQAAIIDHHWLVTAANWVYVYGHWPVIATCAVVLYVFRRDRYLLLRNAMFISGLAGFAFFALFPVAPPRLADPALVDTVGRYSEGYRTLQPPSLTNQYAAMPSLHAGWNLLLGIVIFGTTSRILVRAFALVMPAAMILSVVATANHFILDPVVGVALALGGLFVVGLLQRGRLRRRARESRSSRLLGPPSLRHRPPLGQLTRGGSRGRVPRGRRDRGGRAPVPRQTRGAPLQDRRAAPDPVGPLGACESARAEAHPR
jgi:membrane-associated phospholipid phosphatase